MRSPEGSQGKKTRGMQAQARGEGDRAVEEARRFLDWGFEERGEGEGWDVEAEARRVEGRRGKR